MARIWQIRQSEAPDRYGDMDYRKPKYETDEEMEAYECGYEEGYEVAMKESMGQMGSRGNYGGRGGSGYRMDDSEMGSRRGHGYRGRM